MSNEMHFEVGERLLSDMDRTTAGEFRLEYRTTGPKHRTTGGAPECEENALEGDRTTGGSHRYTGGCQICFILALLAHF